MADRAALQRIYDYAIGNVGAGFETTTTADDLPVFWGSRPMEKMFGAGDRWWESHVMRSWFGGQKL